MECSLYTITQRFEGSVLNTDLKTVIKRKPKGWGGEAPCAQALQRMLNFPLAQLKILTEQLNGFEAMESSELSEKTEANRGRKRKPDCWKSPTS